MADIECVVDCQNTWGKVQPGRLMNKSFTGWISKNPSLDAMIRRPKIPKFGKHRSVLAHLRSGNRVVFWLPSNPVLDFWDPGSSQTQRIHEFEPDNWPPHGPMTAGVTGRADSSSAA